MNPTCLRGLALPLALLAACTRGDAASDARRPVAEAAPPPAAAQHHADLPPRARPAPPPPAARTHRDAHAFWRDFREATLAADTARLLALTRFPFRTTGEIEGDPATEHDRASFPAVYLQLLRQHHWPTLNDSLTMRELVERTSSLKAENFNGGTQHFHVGAFYFGADGGHWQLLEAYQAGR